MSKNQDNAPEAEEPTENVDLSLLQKQLESTQAELEKVKNDYLYSRAEFDNYKKQAIRERSQYIKFASEAAFRDLLTVLDNFRLALQIDINPENMKSFYQGVDMIYKEFANTLERYGVSEVPSEGAAFDPSLHEALGFEENEEVAPNHISRVLKKPYKLHDKLIRPGQVIIAKEKNSKQDDSGSEEQ